MLDIFLWIAIFISGYTLIYFAADWFIDGLKDLAEVLRISPFIVGMLILGIDPEESIASILGAANALPIVAYGNVVGNTIVAILFCLMLPGAWYTLKFRPVPPTYRFLLGIMTLSLFASILFPYGFLCVGVLNLIIWFYHLRFSLKSAAGPDVTGFVGEVAKLGEKELKETEINEASEEEKRNKKKVILICIGAFLLIFIGGELLILATENLIGLTGVAESIFGFVIIAIATNVEEITLVAKAIKKRQQEIGVGGMVGKILWNLGISFGVSGLFAWSLPFSWVIVWNDLILLASVGLLLAPLARGQFHRTYVLIVVVFLALFAIVNFL